MGIGDIAKQLGLLWGKQTPKDKQPHEAKAAKLKEKYEKVRSTPEPLQLSLIVTDWNRCRRLVMKIKCIFVN